MLLYTKKYDIVKTYFEEDLDSHIFVSHYFLYNALQKYVIFNFLKI